MSEANRPYLVAAAQAINQRLAGHSKYALAHLPTPLEPLTALTASLRRQGPTPELWIKRDDCTGLAGGGNKTRKLEYLIADAQQQGADTVITYGAVQSNHARQTAAACAHAGLACELFLSRQVPAPGPDYECSGNVLLNMLCGAKTHLLDSDQVAAAAQERIAELTATGRNVYQIPAGGSNAIGALGYVACMAELLEQTANASLPCHHLIHASSSAGTQAGLLAGLTIAAGTVAQQADLLPSVCGVNVYHRHEQRLRERIEKLASQIATQMGQKPQDQSILPGALQLDSDSLGPGYGIPDEATLEAVRLLASTHGILLDPAYSGKAFAALLRRVRAGLYPEGETLVFLHTGGAMVLPVYQATFGTQ